MNNLKTEYAFLKKQGLVFKRGGEVLGFTKHEGEGEHRFYKFAYSKLYK